VSAKTRRAAVDPDPRFAWVPPVRVLRRGRRAWLLWFGAGVLMALAWALLASTRMTAGGPLCALRRLAGLDCPTCGLTRALGALARGAWRESLALHPWAPVLALQAAAAWALWGAWLAGRLRTPPDRWCPPVLIANLAALVVVWLARLVAGTLPG
jgi:hypothetical protein